MLTSFTIKKTFNKLQIVVYVDEAGHSVMVKYDGRIVVLDDHITYQGVSYRKSGAIGSQSLTPEFVGKWLSEAIGEHGSRVEALESFYRQRFQSAG